MLLLSAADVEQYVLLAADASHVQHQQEANVRLTEWMAAASSNNNDHQAHIADTLRQVVQTSQREVVLFYALTSYTKLTGSTPTQRAAMRQDMLMRLLQNHSHSNHQPQQQQQSSSSSSSQEATCWSPPYMRTKVGVLLAKMIQWDVPHAWPTAFEELQQPPWITQIPDIVLRTLVALMEDFQMTTTHETAASTKSTTMTNLKDFMRGYHNNSNTGNSHYSPPPIPPSQSISGQLLQMILSLLSHALESINNNNNNNNGSMMVIPFPDVLQTCVLSLTVLKGFMSWLDLSLLVMGRETQQQQQQQSQQQQQQQQQQSPLTLLFASLAKGSVMNSPLADVGVLAVECLEELMARGMDDDDDDYNDNYDGNHTTMTNSSNLDNHIHKKIALLMHIHVLEQIHTHVNLTEVDASPIDVVMEVAKFINRTGLEILPLLQEQQQQQDNNNNHNGGFSGTTATTTTTTLKSQLLDLFFRCFAFDDIDVSGAVIPLAGSLVGGSLSSSSSSSGNNNNNNNNSNDVRILSQLLTISYRQMRYPEDFQFDYEDDDEAEEDMYRNELRKLYIKFIRAAPDTCLQFTCQALSQLPSSLSQAPTSDVEAALRLVYHYCEGIRPPPGMKVVMRNETFRSLLVALHNSDITLHPHREVLNLYYEIAVRYHPLLKESPELLQKILQSLTGPRGLQHESARVRSRCCYMLLRLVKTVGNPNKKGESVLRPYVETAITGILALLDNSAAHLRTEDTLNLFETIGLLLGKTGLDPVEQQQYLTQVMTPHVRSIERVLENKQLMAQEMETQGEILSRSVAAIAMLSKGFKNPSEQVQVVLLETTRICLAVLESAPDLEPVRNKSFVLIQRLIQCLDDKVLPSMPQLLYLLNTHCTTEDILDVSQLLNQLCIKFEERAIPALDGVLLPFLQKCYNLSISNIAGVSPNDTNRGSPTFLASVLDPDGGMMLAPHMLTEQLSIRKLSYAVLRNVVSHGLTQVLLSPTNLSSLENVLQSMKEGAIHLEDPPVQKTCIIFFKDLLDQWVPATAPNDNGNNNNTNAIPSHHQTPDVVIVQGYVTFVCDILLRAIFQSYLQQQHQVQGSNGHNGKKKKKMVNVEDANEWRCVLELAVLLEILQTRLPNVYYHQVVGLVGTLVHPHGGTVIVEGFRTAANRKGIESALKSLILFGASAASLSTNANTME